MSLVDVSRLVKFFEDSGFFKFIENEDVVDFANFRVFGNSSFWNNYLFRISKYLKDNRYFASEVTDKLKEKLILTLLYQLSVESESIQEEWINKEERKMDKTIPLNERSEKQHESLGNTLNIIKHLVKYAVPVRKIIDLGLENKFVYYLSIVAHLIPPTFEIADGKSETRAEKIEKKKIVKGDENDIVLTSCSFPFRNQFDVNFEIDAQVISDYDDVYKPLQNSTAEKLVVFKEFVSIIDEYMSLKKKRKGIRTWKAKKDSVIADFLKDKDNKESFEVENNKELNKTIKEKENLLKDIKDVKENISMWKMRIDKISEIRVDERDLLSDVSKCEHRGQKLKDAFIIERLKYERTTNEKVVVKAKLKEKTLLEVSEELKKKSDLRKNAIINVIKKKEQEIITKDPITKELEIEELSIKGNEEMVEYERNEKESKIREKREKIEKEISECKEEIRKSKEKLYAIETMERRYRVLLNKVDQDVEKNKNFERNINNKKKYELKMLSGCIVKEYNEKKHSQDDKVIEKKNFEKKLKEVNYIYNIKEVPKKEQIMEEKQLYNMKCEILQKTKVLEMIKIFHLSIPNDKSIKDESSRQRIMNVLIAETSRMANIIEEDKEKFSKMFLNISESINLRITKCSSHLKILNDSLVLITSMLDNKKDSKNDEIDVGKYNKAVELVQKWLNRDERLLKEYTKLLLSLNQKIDKMERDKRLYSKLLFEVKSLHQREKDIDMLFEKKNLEYKRISMNEGNNILNEIKSNVEDFSQMESEQETLYSELVKKEKGFFKEKIHSIDNVIKELERKLLNNLLFNAQDTTKIHKILFKHRRNVFNLQQERQMLFEKDSLFKFLRDEKVVEYNSVKERKYNLMKLQKRREHEYAKFQSNNKFYHLNLMKIQKLLYKLKDFVIERKNIKLQEVEIEKKINYLKGLLRVYKTGTKSNLKEYYYLLYDERIRIDKKIKELKVQLQKIQKERYKCENNIKNIQIEKRNVKILKEKAFQELFVSELKFLKKVKKTSSKKSFFNTQDSDSDDDEDDEDERSNVLWIIKGKEEEKERIGSVMSKLYIDVGKISDSIDSKRKERSEHKRKRKEYLVILRRKKMEMEMKKKELNKLENELLSQSNRFEIDMKNKEEKIKELKDKLNALKKKQLLSKDNESDSIVINSNFGIEKDELDTSSDEDEDMEQISNVKTTNMLLGKFLDAEKRIKVDSKKKKKEKKDVYDVKESNEDVINKVNDKIIKENALMNLFYFKEHVKIKIKKGRIKLLENRVDDLYNELKNIIKNYMFKRIVGRLSCNNDVLYLKRMMKKKNKKLTKYSFLHEQIDLNIKILKKNKENCVLYDLCNEYEQLCADRTGKGSLKEMQIIEIKIGRVRDKIIKEIAYIRKADISQIKKQYENYSKFKVTCEKEIKHLLRNLSRELESYERSISDQNVINSNNKERLRLVKTLIAIIQKLRKNHGVIVEHGELFSNKRLIAYQIRETSNEIKKMEDVKNGMISSNNEKNSEKVRKIQQDIEEMRKNQIENLKQMKEKEYQRLNNILTYVQNKREKKRLIELTWLEEIDALRCIIRFYNTYKKREGDRFNCFYFFDFSKFEKERPKEVFKSLVNDIRLIDNIQLLETKSFIGNKKSNSNDSSDNLLQIDIEQKNKLSYLVKDLVLTRLYNVMRLLYSFTFKDELGSSLIFYSSYPNFWKPKIQVIKVNSGNRDVVKGKGDGDDEGEEVHEVEKRIIEMNGILQVLNQLKERNIDHYLKDPIMYFTIRTLKNIVQYLEANDFEKMFRDDNFLNVLEKILFHDDILCNVEKIKWFLDRSNSIESAKEVGEMVEKNVLNARIILEGVKVLQYLFFKKSSSSEYFFSKLFKYYDKPEPLKKYEKEMNMNQQSLKMIDNTFNNRNTSLYIKIDDEIKFFLSKYLKLIVLLLQVKSNYNRNNKDSPPLPYLSAVNWLVMILCNEIQKNTNLKHIIKRWLKIKMEDKTKYGDQFWPPKELKFESLRELLRKKAQNELQRIEDVVKRKRGKNVKNDEVKCKLQ